MNDLQQLRPDFDRAQQRALLFGIGGIVLLGLGAFFDLQQFYQSYLLAYVFWISFALGCVGILSLHHLVSGQWGFVIQRLTEAGARTIPFMAALFLPVLLGLEHLYPWARPEAHENHLLHLKSGYLNFSFFTIRAAVYFAFWIGTGFLLSKWSRRQDQTGDPTLTGKMRRLSAPALIVYVLTVTYAWIDWLMSLEPEWFSSIYGMLAVVSQVLSTLALCIVSLRLLVEKKPFSDVLTTRHYHHLGNLLLAFTILWAYMSFSQYLIIWSGNLPEENFWYLRRLGSGWNGLALFLVVGHFFIPFLLLLSRTTKRVLGKLSLIALGIIVMRFVDLFWLITPAFNPEQIQLHWMDLAASIGLGGVWIAFFIRNLKGYPLLAQKDPRFIGLLEQVQS